MKNQTKKSIKQLKRPTSKNIKVGCFTFFFLKLVSRSPSPSWESEMKISVK